MIYWTEVYTEPCKTNKVELFAKLISDWKQLTIFGKSSILVVWKGSEYASADIK